jgi:hypothetical protein
MINGTLPVDSKIIIPDDCTHYVIDNYIHTIVPIVVDKLIFNYERELNTALREWLLSEKGKWVRSHSIRPIKYHSMVNPATFNPTCFLRAAFFGKDATFYQLKWPTL